jgi:hypothetical protein
LISFEFLVCFFCHILPACSFYGLLLYIAMNLAFLEDVLSKIVAVILNSNSKIQKQFLKFAKKGK